MGGKHGTPPAIEHPSPSAEHGTALVFTPEYGWIDWVCYAWSALPRAADVADWGPDPVSDADKSSDESDPDMPALMPLNPAESKMAPTIDRFEIYRRALQDGVTLQLVGGHLRATSNSRSRRQCTQDGNWYTFAETVQWALERTGDYNFALRMWERMR